MKQPESMCKVRNAVYRNIGRKVRIKSNKGRNKVDIAEGTIKQTYPFLFSVELDSDPQVGSRTISFSYADVLTKEVELVLC